MTTTSQPLVDRQPARPQRSMVHAPNTQAPQPAWAKALARGFASGIKRREKSLEHALSVIDTVDALRAKHETLGDVADALNADYPHLRTPRGHAWTHTAVRRVLQRCGRSTSCPNFWTYETIMHRKVRPGRRDRVSTQHRVRHMSSQRGFARWPLDYNPGEPPISADDYEWNRWNRHHG